MKSTIAKTPPHVHSFRFDGKTRIKYGESLHASCRCGVKKVTVSVTVPPQFTAWVRVVRSHPRSRPTTPRP